MLNKLDENGTSSMTGDDYSLLLADSSSDEVEPVLASQPGSQSSLSSSHVPEGTTNTTIHLYKTEDVGFTSMATRGEVNGAAAVFGVAGLLLAGPVVGIVAASGSAHFAAHKSGKFANFTRRCGAYWDGIVNKSNNNKNEDSSKNESKDECLNPKTAPNSSSTRAQQQGAITIWDKITDGLLEGAEWTERKLTRTSTL